MSNLLPIEQFKIAGIPRAYYDNGLKSSKDILGDDLFDLTDPDKVAKLREARKSHFWLFAGDSIPHGRELMFLLARSYVLSHLDVMCASVHTIARIMTMTELDQDSMDFIERVRTCDFLFLEDFHDGTLNDTWSMTRMSLLIMLRRRIESHKHIITYSTHTLALCDSWPKSFLDFLSYHTKVFPLRGIRK